MNRSALALLAAAATGIQVGAAIVATRYVVGQTTPVSLAMLRYAIGILCLLPAAWFAGAIRIARRDWVPIALLGIGQFGVLIVLLNYGLKSTPSARAALIFATFPLLTLCIAAMLRHERMTIARTTGILVTLAGVGIALSERMAAQGVGHWTGDAAVGASALVGALCSVLYRPCLRRYPALPMSVLAMLASVLFLAALSLAEGSIGVPARLGGRAWAAITFIGVISGIGYFLWLFALRHAAATRVTIFLALSPITAAVLGMLLLNEAIRARVVAGMACVAAGRWLGTRVPSGSDGRAPLR